MAKSNKVNDQNKKSIQELESQLSAFGEMTDSLTQLRKLLQDNTEEMRRMSSFATQINSTYKDAIELQAKIGSEFIKEKNIKERIQKSEGLSEAINSRILAKQARLNTAQKQELRNLETKQKAVDKYQEKVDKELELIEKLKTKGKSAVEIQKAKNRLRAAENGLLAKQVDLDDDLNDLSKDADAKKLFFLKQQKKTADGLTETFKKQTEQIRQGNKEFMRRKQLQDAMDKIVPGLSNKLKQIKEAKEVGGGAGAMLAAVPVVGALYSIFEVLFKIAARADDQVTRIAKKFGIVKETAIAVRKELQAAAAGYNVTYSIEEAMKAQFELNDAFGTAIVMNRDVQNTVAGLQKTMGMAGDETKRFAELAGASRKDFSATRNEILGAAKSVSIQSKVALDMNSIFKRVLAITGDIRANFRGNISALAETVAKAKTLGVTLEQVQKTSESLLSFETSIESELEAELLIGKSINLERARAAALTGDMATVMEEMVSQAGDFDEFMQYNVLQQSALAKAFGFTRAEMSDMLFEQKAIEKLREQGYDATEKNLLNQYQLLKKSGQSQDQLNQLLGEEVNLRLQQQDIQDRFDTMIEKIKDLVSTVFGDKLIYYIEWLLKKITTIIDYFAAGGDLHIGRGLLGGTYLDQDKLAQATANTESRMMQNAQPIQDAYLNPGGSAIIKSNAGTFRTRPDDSLLVGTNVGPSSGQSKIDTLIELAKQQLAIMSTEKTVKMDWMRTGTYGGMSASPYA